ncbi:hypothetical protein KEM56_007069 [Ascosphaera pollenicola]|nr:hypothetical protein KEM56_007069 [Ascosphaera pollenicola]
MAPAQPPLAISQAPPQMAQPIQAQPTGANPAFFSQLGASQQQPQPQQPMQTQQQFMPQMTGYTTQSQPMQPQMTAMPPLPQMPQMTANIGLMAQQQPPRPLSAPQNPPQPVSAFGPMTPLQPQVTGAPGPNMAFPQRQQPPPPPPPFQPRSAFGNAIVAQQTGMPPQQPQSQFGMQRGRLCRHLEDDIDIERREVLHIRQTEEDKAGEFCCMLTALAARGFRSGEKRCNTTTDNKDAGSLLDTKDDILFHDLQGRKRNIREYLQSVIAEGRLPNIDPVRRIEQRDVDSRHGTMLSETLVQGNETEDSLVTESHEYADAEDDGASRFLSPGDLVILGANGWSDGQLAIYVRSIGSQQQFYSMRGNWRIGMQRDAELVCEKIVSPELFEQILPFFPDAHVEDGPLPQIAMEGGVPRGLGAPLIELMRYFDADVIAYHRQYHEQLDNLFNLLAREHDYRIVTLDEILRETLNINPGSATETLRYAIRKAIHRSPYLISPNKAGPFIESFTVQPKDRSDAIDQVVEWVREYQGARRALLMGEIKSMQKDHPLATFVRKARKLVSISRELRKPNSSSSVSPSEKKILAAENAERMTYLKKEAERLTEDDMKIVTYLRSYVLHPSQMSAGSLRSTASYIVRNTGLYSTHDLSAATCYLFLQELGIFKPWENQHLLTDNLQLPGHGLAPAVDKLVEDTDKHAETLDESSLVDTMKDIRTDWGDLPVFCVDAVEAAEIDDGFSIEPVKGSEDTYWVRVHVANPSAYIPHDSSIAERAQVLKRSFYTPERVYAMLPGRLTNKNFSLAPGRPAITFSAKVNKNGEILESDVRSGIVNNVIYFTPEKLRNLLGVDNSGLPTMTLAVGDEFQARSRPGLIDVIPAEHHDSLRQLFDIMSARRDRRVDKGGLDVSNRYPANVKVWSGRKRIEPYNAGTTTPVHYTGDPSIRSKAPIVDIFKKFDGVRDDLVSHVMLLAGEVAGKWCADRGIPAIYSATMYHPEFKKITRDVLADAAEGLSTFGLPKGYTTSSPDTHDFLGMDQYLKTTSPLRRFSDLMAHWQIEAALRYEDTHGRPLKPSEADAVVPFPKAAVDALLSRATWQNMQKDLAQRRSRSFWACQLLFRAFHFREAEVPTRWQCLIKGETKVSDSSGVDERAYVGSMQPFDFLCVVRQPRSMAPVQAGDLVEVELEDVDVYTLTIATKMTDMIKRPPMGPLAAMGFLL